MFFFRPALGRRTSTGKTKTNWATPHASFPLDGPNGHDEVPWRHCVSDGKWVTFYKSGDEVWACNAMYAAAHFDFTPVSSGCSSVAD